tara:strand:- start:5007 stop:5621 length:615 start_codon:yes stop_codon:yes gene_type:complete
MIENISFLIISGLILRFSLSLTGQNWVKTYQQTIAFLVLPVVTFVITKTITGNIALSLGMIGALSIVRFRNPVKSALELVMYFVLITLGIAASVNIQFAYILLATCIIIIGGTRLIQFFLKKFFKQPFYNVSFNEGMSLNTIEIYSSNTIEEIEKNRNIKNIVIMKNTNEIIYRLSFESSKELNLFKDSIKDKSGVNKIDVSYV